MHSTSRLPAGGHQLPAADGGAGRRPGKGPARRMHVVQHNRHCRGVGQVAYLYNFDQQLVI